MKETSLKIFKNNSNRRLTPPEARGDSLDTVERQLEAAVAMVANLGRYDNMPLMEDNLDDVESTVDTLISALRLALNAAETYQRNVGCDL